MSAGRAALRMRLMHTNEMALRTRFSDFMFVIFLVAHRSSRTDYQTCSRSRRDFPRRG